MSSVSTRQPTSIEVRATALTWAWSNTTSPTCTGDMKSSRSIDAVTTAPPARDRVLERADADRRDQEPQAHAGRRPDALGPHGGPPVRDQAGIAEDRAAEDRPDVHLGIDRRQHPDVTAGWDDADLRQVAD